MAQDLAAPDTLAARRTRASGFSAWFERHFKWLIVAPAALLILLLSIYPLAFSLWVNFVNYDFQIPGHAFVGLGNFEQIIDDPLALSSLVTTVLLTVADGTFEFVLGLGLALIMVRSFRGRGVIISILIVPLFISPVIVGQSWAMFLQRRLGPADFLLSQLFGHPVTISWLTERPWTYVAIVIADAWQWTPIMFVILLAGLASISPHLYEAAELDGVSPFQAFRFVTLPQLAPIIWLAITFRLLDAVKLFDVIFILTDGGPGSSPYTASFYLYHIGFQHLPLTETTAAST